MSSQPARLWPGKRSGRPERILRRIGARREVSPPSRARRRVFHTGSRGSRRRRRRGELLSKARARMLHSLAALLPWFAGGCGAPGEDTAGAAERARRAPIPAVEVVQARHGTLPLFERL